MRAVLVVLVILIAFGLVGWLRFGSPDGDPTISVDTEKVRQDTSAIVDKTKEVTRNAVNGVDTAAENIDASINRDPIETQ